MTTPAPLTTSRPTPVVDAILALLAEKGPCAPRVIVAAIGCSPWNLYRVMAPLVADGRVISAGASARTRYGLPGQNLAAFEAPGQTRPNRSPHNRKALPKPDTLVEVISELLSSGASYSAAEAYRFVRRSDAETSMAMVVELLEQYAADKRVVRIVVGESLRYRKLVNRAVAS